jgi:hypothetical protein
LDFNKEVIKEELVSASTSIAPFRISQGKALTIPNLY